MNPGPVVDGKNTQTGSAPVSSSGTPLPRTQEPDFGVEGKNKAITHGAEISEATGKAFSQEKVDGAADGEKHLSSGLNKQQLPSGARELKEVSHYAQSCQCTGLHQKQLYHLLLGPHVYKYIQCMQLADMPECALIAPQAVQSDNSQRGVNADN